MARSACRSGHENCDYTASPLNVFLKTEPLQFEVLIVNTPEQLAQNPRARLEYEVYDVYHTVVEHKSLPLKDLQPLPAETFAAKSPWKRTYERATRKTIILSPDLSTQVGRFFYFDARVTARARRLLARAAPTS